MYPTDGGGHDGEESLDWLWDLEGYDVGSPGGDEPTGEMAAFAPAVSSPTGVKKHLRKQAPPSEPVDEFATEAFSLEPELATVGVPMGIPEFSAPTAFSPAVSPMEAEYVQRSRRPLMAAAALLIVGLGTGVALAMSGGGGSKTHVAQPAKVSVSPTTTETTVAAETTTAPSDTTVPTTVVGTQVAAAATPPPGTTIPPYTPPAKPICVRLVMYRADPSTTTATTAPPTTAPPTTAPPTTAPPTTAPPTTAPPTTAPPTTAPPTTAPPTSSPPGTAPPRTSPPPPVAVVRCR